MFKSFRRKSIKTKLLEGFICVIIFSTVLLTITFVHIIHSIQMENAIYLLDAASKTAWDMFNSRPAKLEGILSEICILPELQNAFEEQNGKKIGNFIRQWESKYPSVTFWIATDEKGLVLNQANTDNKKFFLPWIIKDSIFKQKTIISTEIIADENIPDEVLKLYVDNKSFKYALATVVICPVANSEGKTIGSVAGCFLLNSDDWMADEYTSRVPDTYLSVGLNDGVRIISNIETSKLALPVGSYQKNELIKTIAEKKQYYGKIVINGQEAIIKVDPIINYNGEVVGNIGAGTPIKTFIFFEKPNNLTILKVCMFVFIFAVWLANFISKAIVTHIAKLEHLALMIDNNQANPDDIKWSSNGEPKEVFSLANSMIKMARSLRTKEIEAQSYIKELAYEREKLEEKVRLRTQELVITVERLQLTNQYKSQFLANMSHELRTPLNAVIGFSKLLRDQISGELNVKQMYYTETIIRSSEELLQLINDILDLEKIEQGKESIDPKIINIKELTESAILVLNNSIKEKDLILSFSAGKNLPDPTWDYTKVKQVITNLISNAVKFTPKGGSIEITAEARDENILFIVKDTGIGIKEDNREKVFLAFEQADSSYSRSFKGTGLGLAICKKNVELHHGSIWIENNEPAGTIIHVLLPVSPFEYKKRMDDYI